MLGLVIVAGATRERDGIMRFSPRLPNDTATLLLLATFIIVLIGLADATHDRGQPPREDDLDRRRGRDARGLRVWLVDYLSPTTPRRRRT